jgi:RHS repeat-associated protein
VNKPIGADTTFVYSADGARIKRAHGGAATYYIGPIEIETNQGDVTETHTIYDLGGGVNVVRVVTSPGDDGEITFTFGDHLGSSSTIWQAGELGDTDPGVTSYQRYYPYGEPRDAYNPNLPTDHTFTGQITDGLLGDGGTGLMYYGARYYDPQVGRFAAADTIIPNPANPQDLNRYTYVGNNPVNGVDPSGHSGGACLVGAGAGTVVGGPGGAVIGCVSGEVIFWIGLGGSALLGVVVSLFGGGPDIDQVVAESVRRDVMAENGGLLSIDALCWLVRDHPNALAYLGVLESDGSVATINAAMVDLEAPSYLERNHLIAVGLGYLLAGAGEEHVREVLDRLPKGESDPHKQVGSEDELDEVFEELTEGATPVENLGGWPVYEFPDGTRVQRRPYSSPESGGGPTIDVYPASGGPTIKVHVGRAIPRLV